MGPVEIIYVVHEASCVGYFAHLLVLVVEDFKGELVVVWDEVLPTGVTFARTGSPPFHSLNNDLHAGHRCRLARVGVNGNGISVSGGISSGSHCGPGADSPVLLEVFSPELGGASVGRDTGDVFEGTAFCREGSDSYFQSGDAAREGN